MRNDGQSSLSHEHLLPVSTQYYIAFVRGLTFLRQQVDLLGVDVVLEVLVGPAAADAAADTGARPRRQEYLRETKINGEGETQRGD